MNISIAGLIALLATPLIRISQTTLFFQKFFFKSVKAPLSQYWQFNQRTCVYVLIFDLSLSPAAKLKHAVNDLFTLVEDQKHLFSCTSFFACII